MIYHVFNKSIKDFVIFNNHAEYSRMFELIKYYQVNKPVLNFAKFIKLRKKSALKQCVHISDEEKLVSIIAYCLMPTHVHLILEKLKDNGISTFIGNILNSYTRYFNKRHDRKGPLWESRTKKISVEDNNQFIHLTRYIHLNPVTAYIVDKPETWPYSSYQEYAGKIKKSDRICNFKHLIDMDTRTYIKFVGDGIKYQREMGKIKSEIFA